MIRIVKLDRETLDYVSRGSRTISVPIPGTKDASCHTDRLVSSSIIGISDDGEEYRVNFHLVDGSKMLRVDSPLNAAFDLGTREEGWLIKKMEDALADILERSEEERASP